MNSGKSDLRLKEQFRVVINREANEALETFVAELASGSESSKLSKSDVANYVFTRVKRLLGSAETEEIRTLFFDAKKALEVILKGAANSEELPEDLRDALLKHYRIKTPLREKRAKKLSTEEPVENLK